MSTRWERFAGDEATFAVRMAFHPDPDDGQGADADTSASWGAVQVWVDGVNLCAHTDQGETLQWSHWYLLPLLEWLTYSWDPLFHEERLPSSSGKFTTASDLLVASPPIMFGAADRPESNAADDRRFDWEQRHSLRSARDGGILPEVHMRRLRDELEISWDNTLIAGAEDAEFQATRGHALQQPTQVADSLHEILTVAVEWLVDQRPASERMHRLAESVAGLSSLSRTEERTAWLAGLGASRTQIVDRWRSVTSKVKAFADAEAFDGLFIGASDNPLVLNGSCEAALLFGSVAPTIDDDDALTLAKLLLERFERGALDGLDDLVEDEPIDPNIPAWEHGYELAEVILAEAGGEMCNGIVDVEHFLTRRGVQLRDITLSDRRVRAVSFAGPNHSPTIALNTESPFYPAPGRRFTLAHELCHLLFDRTRGARLSVASGPWAPQAIEKRANAFAAMLLMPVDLVTRTERSTGVDLASPEGILTVAKALAVSSSALAQHAGNIGLIDDQDRPELLDELYPTG